jgi:hypothetical protein
VLPGEDKDRVVRMSRSRGVSAARAVNLHARGCPVVVMGINLNVGYYCVCAGGVRVRIVEGLDYGVKVWDFFIASPLE